MPHHLEVLNEYLLKLASREITRLMVNMPPRHGKSMLCSENLPAWWLGTFPDEEVILASYEESFSATFGMKARDTFREHAPSVFGLELDPGRTSKDEWGVRGHPFGGMKTAGMKGAITGKGASLMLIDDPHKNKTEAASPLIQETIWDTYRTAVYTRLAPNGVIMVIQTRWHDLDLSGRILKLEEEIEAEGEDGEPEKWVVLNLAALAEPGDPLGRVEGDALWPERFPAKRLKNIRKRIGPKNFVALYQGKPTPDEGNILRREWMTKRYDPNHMPDFERVIQTVDSAFKTGVANDYSVIATWGVADANLYLIDLWRDKVTFPDLKSAINDNYLKWQDFGCSATYVEDAASGQSVIQELQRETLLPVLPVAPIGSQMSRVEAVSGIFEAGHVKLPKGKPWLADWIEEHVRYPDGAHDDQVLTTAYAVSELVYGGSPIMEFV